MVPARRAEGGVEVEHCTEDETRGRGWDRKIVVLSSAQVGVKSVKVVHKARVEDWSWDPEFQFFHVIFVGDLCGRDCITSFSVLISHA
jgi:hypothetical protein